MATLRKGKCYRKVTRPYTRKSKFKKKGYIKAAPNPKIIRYNIGDLKKKYPKTVVLKSLHPIQIRHNSIESCRMLINKMLQNKMGKDFFFKIYTYPHHVLRENKMLSGAHADRLQTGMSHSFGKSMGLAAQLKKGSKVFEISVDTKNLATAKESLKKARQRLPGKYIIEEI